MDAPRRVNAIIKPSSIKNDDARVVAYFGGVILSEAKNPEDDGFIDKANIL
jgi:hypothetical protein